MSTVQLQSLSPNLIVSNVTDTVHYYTQHLGFIQVAAVPEVAPFGWAMVVRDNVALMFQSPESMSEDLPELGLREPRPAFGTLYITIQGVDALYQQVKDNVTIASAMRTTFYGKKEFTIKDINGFLLTFAEDVA